MRDFSSKMEQITYFSSTRANNKEKCAKLKNKTKKTIAPKNKFLALVFGTRSPEHVFCSNFLHRTVFTMWSKGLRPSGNTRNTIKQTMVSFSLPVIFCSYRFSCLIKIVLFHHVPIIFISSFFHKLSFLLMSFNFASFGEFVPKCGFDGFNYVDLTSFLQAQTQFVPGDQKTPTQLQDCAKKCEHQLCAANGKPHNF